MAREAIIYELEVDSNEDIILMKTGLKSQI